MKIIKKYIDEDNYWKKEYKKTQIYLHHTVSSTADSTINWWNEDNRPISTAYVVDKDGVIYNTFNPKYWSFHLGLKYGPSKGFADKKSIGIEIVNEGGLVKKSDNMYWFDGKAKYNGKFIKLNKPWRGYYYFAKYSLAQFHSVVILLKYLTNAFNIKNNLITDFKYDRELAETYEGILSHCNVRSDKSDVSPAFSLNLLKTKLLNEDVDYKGLEYE